MLYSLSTYNNSYLIKHVYIRVLQVLEVGHGNADALPQLLRPLQATRHVRHVLVDRNLSLLR